MAKPGGVVRTVATTEAARQSQVLARLDHLQRWYDDHAGYQQNFFIVVRVASILIAAGIPLAVALGADKKVLAVMGAVVAALQGLDSAFRFRDHWLLWRATSEQLLHEKNLYLSNAGRYQGLKDPTRVLAVRIEALATREFAEWRGLSADDHATTNGSSESSGAT